MTFKIMESNSAQNEISTEKDKVLEKSDHCCEDEKLEVKKLKAESKKDDNNESENNKNLNEKEANPAASEYIVVL